MVNINKKIYKEIEAYCELNNIADVEFFINKIVVNGFNIEKYGMLKSGDNKKLEEVKVEEKTQEQIVKQENIIETKIDKDDDDRYNELYDRL